MADNQRHERVDAVLRSLCLRHRPAQATRDDDSFYNAVVDQLERVKLEIKDTNHLKENLTHFMRQERRRQHNKPVSVNVSHDQDVVIQNMSNYLQRNICIFDGAEMTTVKPSASDEHQDFGKSILLQRLEGKYFQSLERFLSPVQLIQINPDKELLLVSEAVDKLQQLVQFSGNSNIHVVCLVGKYRGGKSTLLNELIQEENAFSTSNGTKADTHGVWMCFKEKGDKNILYLDTEGSCDPKAAGLGTTRMLLWCLATCTDFMYNHKGAVDDGLFKELFTLGSLQHNKIKNSSHPYLRILLRDFTLNLAGETPTDYFMNILQEEDANDEKHKMLQYFPDIKCYKFFFPPAVINTSSDEFKDSIDILARDIQDRSRVFTFNQSVLSFQEWTGYSEQVIKTINKSIFNSGDDQIDFRQPANQINKERYKISFKSFVGKLRQGLTLEQLCEIEKDEWHDFKECYIYVPGVIDHRSHWEEDVRNQIKDMIDTTAIEGMGRCVSLEEYINDDNQLWNTKSDRKHFLSQLYFQCFRGKIEEEKKTIFDKFGAQSNETRNQQTLLTYISQQNDPQINNSLIEKFSNWKSHRNNTIKELCDIKTTLNKPGRGVRATKMTAFATVSLGLAAYFFMPILIPAAVVGAIVTPTVGLTSYLTTLGLSNKKATEITQQFLQDSRSANNFYPALENLVSASQSSESKGLTITETLASIGIQADIACILHEFTEISRRDVVPFLCKKIACLIKDREIIIDICHYVTLHKVQLLLQ